MCLTQKEPVWSSEQWLPTGGAGLGWRHDREANPTNEYICLKKFGQFGMIVLLSAEASFFRFRAHEDPDHTGALISDWLLLWGSSSGDGLYQYHFMRLVFETSVLICDRYWPKLGASLIGELQKAWPHAFMTTRVSVDTAKMFSTKSSWRHSSFTTMDDSCRTETILK